MIINKKTYKIPFSLPCSEHGKWFWQLSIKHFGLQPQTMARSINWIN